MPATKNKPASAGRPSQQAQQLPMVNHRFEQVFHKDRKTCECAMPMSSKKWNEALGTFVTIRLCCMARAVEELTGLSLYEVDHFTPGWVWDCAELHQAEGADGTVELVERGPPAPWLLKRMIEKGIEVRNLPVKQE